MDTQEPEKKLMPPYATFKGFLNFIDSLRGHPVPHQIDRTLMPTISGSGQAALLGTLRALNLVNEASEPTHELEELIKSVPDSKEFKETLELVLLNSYPFLSDNSFDITRATLKQLEEVFRDYGISGTTVNKAIAFFVAAAKKCDMKVSSYITVRKPATPRKNGNTSKRKKSENPNPQPNPNDFPNRYKEEGIFSFEVPIMGKASAKISFPENITNAEWELIKTIIEAQAGFVLQQNTDD